MRLLLAINPFKERLSAAQATAAVARGLRRPGWRLERLAVADGGPGTLAALKAASGGRWRTLRVPGPLGRPVNARWLDLGADAVIESAEAIGLHRVPLDRRDALAAHSEGLAWLLLQAARLGKRRAYVGLGGSASSDGGTGLARALGWGFLDAAGAALPLGGGSLPWLRRLRSPLKRRLGRLQVLALCDVDDPLYGPRGAAHSYAPQKGARPAQARLLDAGLRRLARLAAPALAQQPGSGAAGGLGFGLQAFAGAKLLPGAATLLALAGFDARLSQADWVITGEGCLDKQTLRGKLPAVVAAQAKRRGIPCLVVCGKNKLSPKAARAAGFTRILCAPAKDSRTAGRALEAAAKNWSLNRP